MWRRCCAGVVDVAGGRGSLAFALHAQHGVTCTVVDPRPPKPTKEQLRYLQRPLGQAACPLDLPKQPTNGQAWAGGKRDLPEHIQAAFDERLWNGPHAQRLHAASLIVGLHPDQASHPCCTPGRMLHMKGLGGASPRSNHSCDAWQGVRAFQKVPRRSVRPSHHWTWGAAGNGQRCGLRCEDGEALCCGALLCLPPALQAQAPASDWRTASQPHQGSGLSLPYCRGSALYAGGVQRQRTKQRYGQPASDTRAQDLPSALGCIWADRDGKNGEAETR